MEIKLRRIINDPLNAEYLWANMKIYFHFLSLLNIEMTQVIGPFHDVSPSGE